MRKGLYATIESVLKPILVDNELLGITQLVSTDPEPEPVGSSSLKI